MSESSDEVRPHDVARTERFFDALANREPVDFTDGQAGDREAAALLEEWRDELRRHPSDSLCNEQDAVELLDRGLAQRRRARRRMAVVSAVAAAVVCVAAFGAGLGQVEPGDALYGVRATILGESTSVHDDKIAVSAEADLNQVEQMIALGQWDQAHDKLAVVNEHVKTVRDAGRKQGLIEKVNRLNAAVVLRSGRAPAAVPTASVGQTSRGAPVITMTPNSFGG